MKSSTNASETSPRGDPPSITRAFLTHAAVVAFALAQPIYDLLGRHPDFLVAHGVRPGQLLLLCLVLSAAPAAAFVVVEIALAGVSRAAALVFRSLLVGSGACLVSLNLASKLEAPSGLVIAGAAALGLAIAWGYSGASVLRRFLLYLSPAALIFPLHFLLGTDARRLAIQQTPEVAGSARVSNPAPVIFLLMDELPVTSLLDGSGAIDGARLPNFAALAAHSTWYANTSTVALFTVFSVPALLSGRYPELHRTMATFHDSPENLYSLLGDHYRIHNFEAITRLCPVSSCGPGEAEPLGQKAMEIGADLGILYLHVILPEKLRRKLPPVDQAWRDFGNARAEPAATESHRGLLRKRARSTQHDFLRFVDEIGAPGPGRPELHFFHMVLPHPPWRYLPSGRLYFLPADRRYGVRLSKSEWESVQAYQRHLLQLGFADRMLGRLLTRLRRVGLYDDALIVVTADHGVSFRPAESRRVPTQGNEADVLMVPWLLKLPHQKQGVVDRRFMETIDLVPTIADALGAEIPWEVDGVSALSPGFPGRDTIRVVRNHRVLEFPVGQLLINRSEAVQRKADLFGWARGTEGLLRIGPYHRIYGESVENLPTLPRAGRFQVTLHERAHLDDVHLDSRVLPTLLTGSVDGADVEGGPMTLAIAVNGRIWAVTHTYDTKPGRGSFMAMIPERALVEGPNRVVVMRLLGQEKDLSLQPPSGWAQPGNSSAESR